MNKQAIPHSPRRFDAPAKGHADISTTANIYTHASSESEREAAVAIERTIFGDLFSIVPKIENRNSSGDLE